MDLERIKDLIGKIPVTPLAVIALAYIGYDYYSFQNFSESPFKQKQNQVEVLEKDNEKLQRELKEAEVFFKNLEQKRFELRQLAQKLDQMRATLTEELDVPALIKMLVTEARKVGLVIRSIKPTEAKAYEFYAEQAFEVSFKGVFVQLLVLLQRLSTVERIVRIENLGIKRLGSSTAQYVQVEGQIQVKVYKYIGSRADEVAKAGGSPDGAAPATGGATK